MPRNEAGVRRARLIYRATLYVDDDDAGVMRRWWDAANMQGCWDVGESKRANLSP